MRCPDCAGAMERLHDGSYGCRVCRPGVTETAVGRPRSPLSVLVLSMVTFGVYFLFYTYQVFAETNRAQGTMHQRLLFWVAHGFVLAFAIIAASMEFGQLPQVAPSTLISMEVGFFVPLAAYWFIETAKVRNGETPVMPSWLMAVIYVLPTAGQPWLDLLLSLTSLGVMFFFIAGVNAWWRARSEEVDRGGVQAEAA